MAIVIRVLSSGEVAMYATPSYLADAGGGDFRAHERTRKNEANEEVTEKVDFAAHVIVEPTEVPAIVRGMIKNGKVHRPAGGVEAAAEPTDEGEDAEPEEGLGAAPINV